MGLLMWVLLACGESATFEEPAPEEDVPVEAEAEPEGSDKAPELQAPIDARPDEVRVQAKPPAPGQAWPPIVVPEGPREREWEWEFQNKGTTKVTKQRQGERARDLSAEEIEDVEMETEAEQEDMDYVYQSD